MDRYVSPLDGKNMSMFSNICTVPKWVLISVCFLSSYLDVRERNFQTVYSVINSYTHNVNSESCFPGVIGALVKFQVESAASKLQQFIQTHPNTPGGGGGRRKET